MIAPAALESQEVSISSLNVRLGVGFPLNSLGTDIQVVQLAPVLEVVGFGMDIQFNDVIFLSPFMDISLDNVLYSEQTGLVHPRSFVDIGIAESTTVLAFYIGAPFMAKFRLGDSIRVGVGLSPTVVFKIPVGGPDRQTVGNYYIEQGRFLYPEAIIEIGYRFQEVELSLATRLLLPISNLWDSDGSPFINDMTVFATIQLRFLLSRDSPTSSSAIVENPNLSANR